MQAEHSVLRRNLLLAMLGACAAGPAMPQAQGRVVRVVVGSPPGALGDVVSRLVAEKLAEALGTATIVDNKAGASGLIAADLVAKSPGDGSTLLVAADNVMVVNPLVYPKIPYTVGDFAPIGVLGKADLVLIAHPASGIRTMQDLVRAARAKPDSITFASGGIGHVTHLGVELIADRLGIKLRHVPYKGTSPAMASLVGGETTLMYSGAAGALPQIKFGRAIALAASGPRVKDTFPGTPLLTEFHPDLDITVWFGLFASAKTPPDTVAALNRALNTVLQRPDVMKRFSEFGMTTDPGPPSAMNELVKSDTTRFAALVKSLNITME